MLVKKPGQMQSGIVAGQLDARPGGTGEVGEKPTRSRHCKRLAAFPSGHWAIRPGRREAAAIRESGNLVARGRPLSARETPKGALMRSFRSRRLPAACPLVLLVSLFLAVPPASAQPRPASGAVVDQDGRPVPRAFVRSVDGGVRVAGRLRRRARPLRADRQPDYQLPDRRQRWPASNPRKHRAAQTAAARAEGRTDSREP